MLEYYYCRTDSIYSELTHKSCFFPDISCIKDSESSCILIPCAITIEGGFTLLPWQWRVRICTLHASISTCFAMHPSVYPHRLFSIIQEWEWKLCHRFECSTIDHYFTTGEIETCILRNGKGNIIGDGKQDFDIVGIKLDDSTQRSQKLCPKCCRTKRMAS